MIVGQDRKLVVETGQTTEENGCLLLHFGTAHTEGCKKGKQDPFTDLGWLWGL
jgi:hypothetical protein